MKRSVLVAVAFGTLSTAAVAADLPRRTAAAAPVAPLAAMNWSGTFVGLQGGWQQHRDSYADMEQGGNGSNDTYAKSTKASFLGGGHIGHNFQAGAYVYGLIADVEIDNTRLDFDGGGWGYTQKLGLQGSIRARAGYAVGSFLPYLTGGVAVAKVATTYRQAGTETFNDLRFGWTIGGGVEYAFTNKWSARLEYRYSGSFTHTPTSAWTGYDDKHSVTTHKTALGVSYRF